MSKLDSLGWAYELAFVAYGLKIGIRITDSNIEGQIANCLPLNWEPCHDSEVDRLYSLVVGGQHKSTRRFNIVYVGTGILVRTLDANEAMDSLRTDLQLYVAENAIGYVFVHAGVVGWRDKAIVIPGRTYSGKTTLTAELAKVGADYYSDEYAVLDEEGRVHSYARPLQIRNDDGRATFYPVEAIGGRKGIKPLPVGLVISTRFDEANTKWQPAEMSAGQIMLEMLENSVAARSRPEDVMSVLKRAVSRSVGLKSARGEASTLIRSILDIVEKQQESNLVGKSSLKEG